MILLLLLLESGHDAPDSSSTLCIRVPSPVVWGRNSVLELRSQKRHAVANDGRGSILTSSPFSYITTIGVPAVNYELVVCSGGSTNCCRKNTWYLVHVVRVVSVSRVIHTTKRNCCFHPDLRIKSHLSTKKCSIRYVGESVVCGGGVEFGKRGPKGPGEREITRGSERSGSGSFSACLLYTSPSPRDLSTSRMPSSA